MLHAGRRLSYVDRFNRYMVECEYNYAYSTSKGLYCFNRYMVECEFIMTTRLILKTTVLIDTWWNVNCTYNQRPLRTYPVLIDTWWNVNYGERS